jgi:hypothetical protein
VINESQTAEDTPTEDHVSIPATAKKGNIPKKKKSKQPASSVA